MRTRRYAAAGRSRVSSLVIKVMAAVIIASSLALSGGATATAGTTTFTGEVDATGVAWRSHAFEVDAAGDIEVSLDWANAGANLNAFLKDPSGAIIAQTVTTAQQPKQLTATANFPGAYRLGIKAVSGASSYSANVVTPETSPLPPSWDYEGDVDAAGTAWRAHRVELEQGQVLSIVLDWAAADANLNLFLKDPDGLVVAASSTRDRPERISDYVVPRAGEYRVGVKARSGASSYTVDLDLRAGSEPPQEFDPWPTLQKDILHTGVSNETVLSARNLSSLEPRWQVQTGDKVFTSPSIVLDEQRQRRLLYVGNSLGTMAAYDAVTGERVWFFDVSGNINSSPTVVDGVVYFGASDKNLYALNASTGAFICKYASQGIVYSSPLVVDPDDTGKRVYFGDVGITGGDDGGNFYAVHAVDPNAATDCSLDWKYSAWGDPPGSETLPGSYSSPAFARLADGRPVVVAGGSSPENAVYAWNAATGERVWRYKTESFHHDEDVAAAPTLSPPGTNGFADGVAYVVAKNRIFYALNLRTGERIWEFRVRDDSPGLTGSTRSSAVLKGRRLYFGYGAGMYALDAVTGAKLWKTQTPTAMEMVSSPAMTGPAGSEVLVGGDLTGAVYGFSAATGQILWSHPTRDFIYGSAAIAGGSVYIGSADGFLYSFGLPDSTGRPHTAIVSPEAQATLDNPAGTLRLSGRATDDTGVDSVNVAVKNDNTNRWYNFSTQSWDAVYRQGQAELANSGASATDWSSGFAVPFHGGSFTLYATAVDGQGHLDDATAVSSFTVRSAGNPPETTISSPTYSQVFHFPEGRASFPIQIRGAATDTAGNAPGVTRVRVTVLNIEHQEYFCGAPGCNGGGGSGEASEWTQAPTSVLATLSDAGGQNTEWSLSFSTYDHPHKYRISAVAVDRDGETDPTAAAIQRICIRDPGDNACV